MPDNLTLEEKNRHRPQQSQDRKGTRRYQGKPMTYEQANKGRRTRNSEKRNGYRVNCQTCTVTHMLRRLGFDIEAKPNIRQSAYNEMAKTRYHMGRTFPEPGRNKAGL
nr:hypothetical protein [Phocaeicola vulgatus]